MKLGLLCPIPISQNLLMKSLRKRRNAPDTGAEDTGAEDKEPETAGLGLKTAGLGAGSAAMASMASMVAWWLRWRRMVVDWGLRQRGR